ncbi:hypothetical protein PSTT_16657 [Puccinia striiformis]|uniref:CTP synthase n=1 Tax=Puccinia striiformis TaxID=27350 RepID=A0A2S4UC39_9BASI|nr:hypothetical protein PSTT_16657 [Puccinia striiformis]
MLGLRVTAIKIDPYLNLDAGTMSPTEHGEVYVLDDGGEADLDLGNYERYLDVTLTREHNITTGKIYSERVSKIPVDEDGEVPDICIVELGGTVGDIESAPFVEAMRQFQFRVGTENFALMHVSLVPVIHGEQKTKPTQSSVRDLRGLGLTPDLIAARCSEPLERSVASKISMFCHVGPDQVVACHDVTSVYHVPLFLKEQGLIRFLSQRLNLGEISVSEGGPRQLRGHQLLDNWRSLTTSYDHTFGTVNIVLVGKYVSLKDSYMSVIKSLEHASLRVGKKLNLQWVDSEHLEKKGVETKEYHAAWVALCSAEGILVPGGFGVRGTEGMMAAAKWAREKRVPFLGICLGFQIQVLEWARNVCGLKDAQSTDDWSAIKAIYGGSEVIWERHRHRYEVNPEYIDRLEVNGFRFTGKDSKGLRMQVAELEGHRFYCGMQAHPEFCTRPLNPSPAYLGFIAASKVKRWPQGNTSAPRHSTTGWTSHPHPHHRHTTHPKQQQHRTTRRDELSPPPPPPKKRDRTIGSSSTTNNDPAASRTSANRPPPKKEKPAPVTMVYRGAPDHQQYTMNPSVTALAPQTAINRGYGCMAIDVPPPSTAAPSYSLTHATEASLMKRKHNRLRDLCRERGLLSPSRELTKREMVQGLLTWREANIGQRSSGFSETDDSMMSSTSGYGTDEEEEDHRRSQIEQERSFEDSIDPQLYSPDLNPGIYNLRARNHAGLVIPNNNNNPTILTEEPTIRSSVQPRTRMAIPDPFNQQQQTIRSPQSQLANYLAATGLNKTWTQPYVVRLSKNLTHQPDRARSTRH